MNKRRLTLISITIPILIGIYYLVTFSNTQPDTSADFMYSDLDEIRDTLATKNIVMSSSVKITDYTAKQYCITGDTNKIITYCLTTALVDSEREPLGNINMGGNEEPITALAIIDTHQLNAKSDEVDTVFQTLVETLVCTCWD